MTTHGLHEALRDIFDEVARRNAGETEFHQAVYEVLTSLGPVVAKHPEYADTAVIRRLCEPERQPGSYVAGANIAGFTRVADAMLALGLV